MPNQCPKVEKFGNFFFKKKQKIRTSSKLNECLVKTCAYINMRTQLYIYNEDL